MQQEAAAAAAAAPPPAARPQAYAPPAAPVPPPAATAQPQQLGDAKFRAALAKLNRKLELMNLPTMPYLPPADEEEAELDEGLRRVAARGGRYARFASALLDVSDSVDQYRRRSLIKRPPLAPIISPPPKKKGRG